MKSRASRKVCEEMCVDGNSCYPQDDEIRVVSHSLLYAFLSFLIVFSIMIVHNFYNQGKIY